MKGMLKEDAIKLWNRHMYIKHKLTILENYDTSLNLSFNGSKNRIAGWAFALHLTDPGAISGTPDDPLSPTGNDLQV